MSEPRRSIGCRLAPGLLVLLLFAAACGDSGSDEADGPTTTVDPVESLRLNEVQVLGSHNSYHLRPAPSVLAALAGFAPDLARELDYEHLPLTKQLTEFGIRQFEIDVYADPDGGRFADRPALAIVGEPTASGEPALDEPGFKVLHSVDIDFRSTCLTLVACLTEIEQWSAGDPEHLPVMVMLEAKQTDVPTDAASIGLEGIDELGVDFTDVLTFDRELFDALEAEILSVFDRTEIVTPDDVRGDAETLEAAVLTGEAWPTLAEARGKVLFGLVDTGDTRDVYIGDATSLEGRLLFTSSEEGRPDAAFIRVDDPIAEGDRIAGLVEAGYLIRTRTDTPGVEAVEGTTERREAASASGAHYLSTDYYVADPELGTGYVVTFEPRCNPVNAPPDCELVAG